MRDYSREDDSIDSSWNEMQAHASSQDRSVQTIVEKFGCTEDDAIRYLNLREEGYSRHQALLMAGLSDPSDN